MTNVRHTRIDTSLGELTVVADDDVITGIYFPEHTPAPAEGSIGHFITVHEDPLLGDVLAQIHEYLDRARTTFDLPTMTCGNDFQERVWAELRALPYGSTTTYGAIAARLGDPRSARAVGSAVGRNPLSILVGCHRVLGAGGKLTGFAGGLERKRALLELEGSLPDARGRLF